MKEQLDMNRIPQHIAIIMDGNGRWAMDRGLDRTFGHKAGLDTVGWIARSATKPDWTTWRPSPPCVLT